MGKKYLECREAARNLPAKPGVYLMRNAVDEIIYVGKAVNLQRRVLQYFQESGKRSKKIEQMIASIDHFTFLLTETELEALILESNLIKKYRPRYNSALRKDENHPYIRIDRNRPFPSPEVCTDNEWESSSIYMGPFYKSMDMEETVRLLGRLFGLRTCKKDFTGGKFDHHPCLHYGLGNCPGVCMGNMSPEAYDSHVRQTICFLKGENRDEVRERLRQQMTEASQRLEFERAVRLRNQLTALEKAEERLGFSGWERKKGESVHLWAFYGDDSGTTVLLYMIRGKNLSGRDYFHIPVDNVGEYAEPCGFLEKFYENAPYIPDCVLVANEVPNVEQLRKYLSDRKKKQVNVTADEEQKRLCMLAAESARLLHENKK